MPEQQNVAEKWERFRDSIMRQANGQIDAIRQEVDTYRASQLDRFQEEIQKDSRHYLKGERRRVEASQRELVSARRAALRKELYLRRSELTEGVFAKVRETLEAFAASGDYAAFLCRKATEAGKLRRGGEVLLLVRPADLKWQKELENACGQPCRVEEDESILLGGLRFWVKSPEGKSADMQGDETLDAALEEQRQWFYESTGLFLTGEQGGEES